MLVGVILEIIVVSGDHRGMGGHIRCGFPAAWASQHALSCCPTSGRPLGPSPSPGHHGFDNLGHLVVRVGRKGV